MDPKLNTTTGPGQSAAQEEEDAVASPASPNTPGFDLRLANQHGEPAGNRFTVPSAADPTTPVHDASADADTEETPAQPQEGIAPATHDLGSPEPLASVSLEELIEHLQTFARENGFALVRSSLRRREDKTPTRLNLLCDRHGHLRNHRGLTDETRVRKRRQSRGVGCPYRIAITLGVRPEREDDATEALPERMPDNVDPALQESEHTVALPPPGERGTPPPPLYRFKVTNSLHNHTPNGVSAHWKHRQLGPVEMKRVRQWYVDKKTPKQMLEALKSEDPNSLFVLKDVQNARAKARAQFLEFLEGGVVKTK